MNCIQISKEDGSTYPLYFTETELEQIYHSAINLKLKKDLIKKVQENYNPSYSWLRVEELEALPELMAWLIEKYWHNHSADCSHNESLKSALAHFHNTAYTPELFQELMAQCQPATPENPRYRMLSAAHESIILHEQGKCSCSYFVKPRLWCATHRYFSMELEISDFIAEFTLIKEENEA